MSKRVLIQQTNQFITFQKKKKEYHLKLSNLEAYFFLFIQKNLLNIFNIKISEAQKNDYYILINTNAFFTLCNRLYLLKYSINRRNYKFRVKKMICCYIITMISKIIISMLHKKKYKYVISLIQIFLNCGNRNVVNFPIRISSCCIVIF